ncbi:MAG TPA: Rid family detoxifying hydrolase [Solirubrobacteraceae bacterium]|nr:Rid family detoxifying hydrolase [Solirubrobacteraceae bacterium]
MPASNEAPAASIVAKVRAARRTVGIYMTGVGSRVDEKRTSMSGGGREAVHAPQAPAAIGPYSHAVRAGGLLFCSGQIPLHPQTGELVGTSAAEQARQCLLNLSMVCEAAGVSLQQAVKVTVYMTDLSAFAEVGEVYASFFEHDPPARVAIGVAALPRGAQVEIDAVVALS